MLEYACSDDVIHRIHKADFDDSLLFLNVQQLRELSTFATMDNPVSKQKAITQSIKLVVNIAKQYSDHGVAIFDLVREGIKGLNLAFHSFEMEDHFSFTAYATRCVRQRIECTILNQIEPE
jgi:RNA polymerase nonessential primary-like sigma factor